MKRILLAATACIGVAMLAPPPAQAQWTVICPTCRQELTDNLAWAQQAADMVRQIQQLQQQYQQLVMHYQAITRITDLGSAYGALSQLGIQNPLPINPYAVQGLLNGSGGPGGMLGSISNLFTGAQTANRIYETPGDTWLNRQINANGGGLAGAQALAMQLYQSSAERVQYLNELQGHINVAADPSEREALIARIGMEQTYIQNANVQAASLGNFMQAQFRVRDQQREERRQQEFDEVLAQATARGLW